MSGKKKSLWKRLTDALTIPPIYAPIKQPSDASLAEGWRIAYEQEKARREAAEHRLDMLRAYGGGLKKLDGMGRFGVDILTIINMTEEELNDDYGDD